MRNISTSNIKTYLTCCEHQRLMKCLLLTSSLRFQGVKRRKRKSRRRRSESREEERARGEKRTKKKKKKRRRSDRNPVIIRWEAAGVRQSRERWEGVDRHHGNAPKPPPHQENFILPPLTPSRGQRSELDHLTPEVKRCTSGNKTHTKHWKRVLKNEIL